MSTSDNLTYWTRNGIDDATAIAQDLRRYLETTNQNLEATELRRLQLLDVITDIRNGNYDPNRPAGKRPQPEP